MRYSKGMQKAMITLGAVIAVMSYTGFPRGFKEIFFLLAGAAVMLVGYKMRQEQLRLAYNTVEVNDAPQTEVVESRNGDEVENIIPTTTQ